MYDKLMVFSGTAGVRLAKQIQQHLSIEHDDALIGWHKDGEFKVQLPDVRGADVFIVNPTNPPAENILQVPLIANAAKLASAGQVTNVLPYLGYCRQERKDRPRVPISAKVVCQILSQNADRVLLTDLHSEAVVGFFEGVVPDHIYSSKVAIPHLSTIVDEDFVIASTDAGGVTRARAYAGLLGRRLVVFHKDRPDSGEVDSDSIIIIGDVKGKKILYVDDIIDSAKTVVADAMAAEKAGAREQYVYAPHLILSDGAITRIESSPLAEIIGTDTIWHEPEELASKKVAFTILPIAPLLARAINNIHQGKSIASLILSK